MSEDPSGAADAADRAGGVPAAAAASLPEAAASNSFDREGVAPLAKVPSPLLFSTRSPSRKPVGFSQSSSLTLGSSSSLTLNSGAPPPSSPAAVRRAQQRGRAQSIGSYNGGALISRGPHSRSAISLSPQFSSSRPVVATPKLPLLSTMTLPMDGIPHRPPLEMRKAVEAAIQAERTRAKGLVEEEKEMTADELRAVLQRERHRMGRMAGDLARLKSSAVHSQAEAEVLEEGRINGLMRRLESLQLEKGRIIVELEREEEMLTNTLQKKLNEVRREKAELENLIKNEQMSRSNLEIKLSGMKGKKDLVAATALSTLTHLNELSELREDEEEEMIEDEDEEAAELLLASMK